MKLYYLYEPMYETVLLGCDYHGAAWPMAFETAEEAIGFVHDNIQGLSARELPAGYPFFKEDDYFLIGTYWGNVNGL